MGSTISPTLAEQKRSVIPKRLSPQGVTANRAFQGIATLTAGSAAAHLMAAAAVPALTRLYTPEDFGVLAAFTAMLAVLTTFSCFSYERAIPLPTKESEALSLVGVCIFITTATTTILLIGIACGGTSIFEKWGAGSLAKYGVLIVPGCLCVSLYDALSYYAFRKKSFSELAWAKVSQGAGMIGWQLGWGLTIGGSTGLLLGDLTGRVLGLTCIGRPIVAQIVGCPSVLSPRSLWQVAKRFWRFPALCLPAALLNRAVQDVPKLILAAVFPPSVLGHLILAEKVLQLPTTFLGQNVARVYIGEFSERRRASPQACQPLFMKLLIGLFFIGLGPMLVVYVLSPMIFPWLFGSQWELAGQFARILAPLILLELAVTPVSTTLCLLERVGLQLGWETFYSSFVCGIIALAAAMRFDPVTIVALYTAARAVAYLIQALLLKEAIQKESSSRWCASV